MDQRPDSLVHNIVHERKSKADESSTLFPSFFSYYFLFFFYLPSSMERNIDFLLYK